MKIMAMDHIMMVTRKAMMARGSIIIDPERILPTTVSESELKNLATLSKDFSAVSEIDFPALEASSLTSTALAKLIKAKRTNPTNNSLLFNIFQMK